MNCYVLIYSITCYIRSFIHFQIYVGGEKKYNKIDGWFYNKSIMKIAVTEPENWFIYVRLINCWWNLTGPSYDQPKKNCVLQCNTM